VDNKRIGGVLVVLSILAGVFAFSIADSFQHRSAELNCNPNAQCAAVNSAMGWSHIGIGIVSAVFALGIYLLFFSRGEYLLRQAIKRLEEEKTRLENQHDVRIADEKFMAILGTLSDSERDVLRIIKEQEGITQNTLRIKADLSKAKLSQMLGEFQRRGLVRREQKGKTFALYVGSF